MMAKLYFEFEPGFLETEIFKQILQYGHYIIEMTKGRKISHWYFKIEDLPTIVKMLEEKIEFNSDDVRLALMFCPPLTQELNLANWKGDSGIKVIELPQYYKLIEYRKQDDGEIKEVIHKISKGAVKEAWEVMKTYELREYVISRKVARDIVVKRHITDFITESIGKAGEKIKYFNFRLFFGSRKKYFDIFYYPIKVLQEHGVVYYHKSGKIMRLSEEWAQEPKEVDKL